jgi:stress response protein YsnF/sporulation protein YlmC with PRC-barrel domain
MATLQKDRILQFRGGTLSDADGDKIGSVEEIYLDAETGAPEWALVNTGLFGTKSTFVPLRDASEAGGELRVPYEKATVKDAPRIDADGQLSQSEESELYRYYGLEYSEARSDSGLPEGGSATGRIDRDAAGGDVSGPETDGAMTRSEEELRVGTTEREAGRARLRKYVVEDEVTKTVPVRREEVRVEREPITDANIGDATSGPDISEEEHEVVLH